MPREIPGEIPRNTSAKVRPAVPRKITEPLRRFLTKRRVYRSRYPRESAYRKPAACRLLATPLSHFQAPRTSYCQRSWSPPPEFFVSLSLSRAKFRFRRVLFGRRNDIRCSVSIVEIVSLTRSINR